MYGTMHPLIKELARDVMGLPPYAIRKWKLRGKVPHMHRLPLIEMAEQRGATLAAGDFEFGKRRPAKKVKKRRAA